MRFRLDNPTPEAVAAKVRAEYGDNVRIISASEVLVGGIGGFFARRFVEVEVELMPDPASVANIVAGVLASPRASLGAAVRPAGPVGIEALLEAADRAEGQTQDEVVIAPELSSVSTQGVNFDRVLQDLNSYATRPTPGPVIGRTLPPELFDEPGGLVLFLGLANDSVVAARSLARTVRHAEILRGGLTVVDDTTRVDDRRSAAAARARGVANESVALVAWGLGVGMTEVTANVDRIRAIAADQIWVVVDAARKPEDTAAWVAVIRKAFPVTALGVVSSVETSTPDSVGALGLPIGWAETVG